MKKFLLCTLSVCTLLSSTSLFAQTQQLKFPERNLSTITPYSAGWGIVTADNVNFRESAGLSSKVICKLNKGDILSEIGDSYVEKDGYTWYPVKYNDTWGYIASDYFESRQ